MKTYRCNVCGWIDPAKGDPDTACRRAPPGRRFRTTGIARSAAWARRLRGRKVNKTLSKDIFYVGVNDPGLTHFDIVIPTECGTTYNSYLVKGTEKTALIDCVKELHRRVVREHRQDRPRKRWTSSS